VNLPQDSDEENAKAAKRRAKEMPIPHIMTSTYILRNLCMQKEK
jgi:hypothetical protein